MSFSPGVAMMLTVITLPLQRKSEQTEKERAYVGGEEWVLWVVKLHM